MSQAQTLTIPAHSRQIQGVCVRKLSGLSKFAQGV